MKNCASIWLFTRIIPGCTVNETLKENTLPRSQPALNSIRYFIFYSQLLSSGATYISSNIHGPDDNIKPYIKPTAACSIETECTVVQNGGV